MSSLSLPPCCETLATSKILPLILFYFSLFLRSERPHHTILNPGLCQRWRRDLRCRDFHVLRCVHREKRYHWCCHDALAFFVAALSGSHHGLSVRSKRTNHRRKVTVLLPLPVAVE